MTEKVSVIMPAFNAGKYIESAIISVQQQTFTAWKLIIVDDGSTDDTAEIIKRLAVHDQRISYYYQANAKQGKARNLAISKSNGDYLTFLDADDLWTTDKLQRQLSYMQQRPDIDLLFSCGYYLDEKQIIDLNIVVKEWRWETDRDTMIAGNQIPILSVMVKRKALLAVGGFNEQLEIQNAEDYHLWLRLLKVGKFLSTADKLFYYRVHPGQCTYQQNNTFVQVAHCFVDLIANKLINYKNRNLRERMKWLIIQMTDFREAVHLLRYFFPERYLLLISLLKLSKWPPIRNAARKAVFYLLYIP